MKVSHESTPGLYNEHRYRRRFNPRRKGRRCSVHDRTRPCEPCYQEALAEMKALNEEDRATRLVAYSAGTRLPSP